MFVRRLAGLSVFCFVIANLAFMSVANAQVVGIAGTPGCIYNSLQDAIDDGEFNLTVTSNVGAASGADWAITSMPNAHVRITGVGSGCSGSGTPVLDMSTGVTRFQLVTVPPMGQLTLTNLEFNEGAGPFITAQGGLPQSAQITLDRVAIERTAGTVIDLRGGVVNLIDTTLRFGTENTPIVVRRGGRLEALDSQIAFNVSGPNDGGGLRLLGGEANLADVGVAWNDADGHGGGIFVGGDALGGSVLTVDATSSVILNDATGDGGGYYIQNAHYSCATGCLDTDVTLGGLVKYNQSNRGGGLAIHRNAKVTIDDADISINTGNSGAGIRVNGGEINISDSLVLNNRGVGFYTVQADVDARRLRIADNDSHGIDARGGSDFFLSNSAIYDNDGDGVNVVSSNVDIEMATFVRNDRPIDYSGSTGDVVSTIMFSNGVTGRVHNGSTVLRDCVRATDWSLGSSGTVTEINALPLVDPQFVDSANQDFHLRSTSPMIDVCPNGSRPDLDGLSGTPATL
ncbi:MAG: right-handed parallel beta-helix repeat-containing protein, partial [Myxococcota bacterium]